jgi:hypothetical protein
MDIDQQAHKLGDGDAGVRVVQLDGIGLVEGMDRSAPLRVYANHVLQRAGREEVLLLEAEDLARHGLVVGIEDLADGLGGDFFVDCVVVVAFVEGLEIE